MKPNVSRAVPVAALIVFLTCAGLAAPGEVRGADTTNDVLVLDSMGDYIGQGERTVLTDADATIEFDPVHLTNGEVAVMVQSDAQTWRLRFTPPDGETLGVGFYGDAGEQPGLSPQLRVSRDSSGCNANTGSFTVHDIDYDEAGAPVSLAVTFEHWCEAGLTPGPLVGLVRVNSATPVGLLSLPTASLDFGSVTVGEATAPRTSTLEAIGDLPVAIESTQVSGDAASEYVVSNDSCAGTSLDPGETCTFDLHFAPKAIEVRQADLRLASDAPEGSRVLPLRGFGRIPTTTSVGVRPDWIYFRPGIELIALVSPAPGHNAVECWFDGELLANSNVNPGSASCLLPRELGTHIFRARYQGSPFYGASWSPELTFEASDTTVVDLSPPPETVVAGVPVTLTAAVSTASDLLYPGGSLTIRDTTTDQLLATQSIDFGASTLTFDTSFAPGIHKLEASYTGVERILLGSSDTLTLTAEPDVVAPTATAPQHALTTGSTLSSGRLPIRLSWSGADDLSGVARYEVSRQTDGGAWSAAKGVTAESYSPALRPDHTYRYRVRAIDHAGNVGPWMYDATFRLQRFGEQAGAARYHGSWSTIESSAYSGGRAKKSSSTGSRVRFTFTGTSVGWLTLKSPKRGRASIYLNGVHQATIDLYAASKQGQVIGWSKTWAKSGTRTLEIRVRGTLGRPRIDIDGFWVAT